MQTESPPRFVARNVLIDVDDTITVERRTWDEPGIPHYFLGVLRDMVAEVRGIPNDEALAEIHAACDVDRVCLSPYIEGLGVPIDAYWARLMQWQEQNVRAYPDAVALIRTLHGRGFRLYTATSNSRFAACAKLSSGGLADREGSPYFAGFFGGDVCEGGKSGPHFFRAILEAGGFDPADVLMIGDNPVNDLLHARQAGIRQVVVPRRDQGPEWVAEPDGGIYVRSLEWVASVLDMPQ